MNITKYLDFSVKDASAAKREDDESISATPEDDLSSNSESARYLL